MTERSVCYIPVDRSIKREYWRDKSAGIRTTDRYVGQQTDGYGYDECAPLIEREPVEPDRGDGGGWW